ncbi:MAG: EamA family transporter [Nanoarchaeota archaeon]|nr:EamA family transporter [Nanoarchaeota archaeon]
MKSLKLIFISIILVTIGAVFLKVGANDIGTISMANLKNSTYLIITNPYIFCGAALYILSSLAWLLAISKTDLSKAYPLMALGYALIPIASWILFNETMSTVRWAGIAIIFTGVMVMAGS